MLYIKVIHAFGDDLFILARTFSPWTLCFHEKTLQMYRWQMENNLGSYYLTRTLNKAHFVRARNWAHLSTSRTIIRIANCNFLCGAYLGLRTCDISFFVSLGHTRVWLLFRDLLASLFSLFFVIREFIWQIPKEDEPDFEPIKTSQWLWPWTIQFH